MFVSDSCTIRYRVVSTSDGRRSSPSCDSKSTDDPGRLDEGLDEPLERRHEAEIVQRLRPQLDRQAANVLQRRHDELPQLRQRRRLVLGVLDRLEPEQDGRERLAGLVVQLACEPAPLALLSLDHAPQRVAPDAA